MINFIFKKMIETSLKQLFHVFDKINKRSVHKMYEGTPFFFGRIFQMMR